MLIVFEKSQIRKFLFLFILYVALACTASAQNDNRVPFRHRVGNPAPENNVFHIRGDFTIIGNTNLTVENYQEDVQNAMEKMKFVDIDNDKETFNSSSATLVFSQENGADPNCSEVVYAGLYWSGRTELDKGLTFETTKKGEKATTVTLDKKKEEIRNSEVVDYFPYTFNLSYAFDSYGNNLPVYEIISYDGLQIFTFQFNNEGEVIYSINYGGYNPVENLKIITENGITTATFDPITFTTENLTFSIGELVRSEVLVIDENYEKNNFIKVVTSGTYSSYEYFTKQFDKRRVKLKAPGSSEYLEVIAGGNAVLFPQGELGEMYVGYADVTQVVRDYGAGQYTIADLALTEGLSDNTGFYGHWGLFVVYQNAKMNLRDVTIFDGYTFVQANNGQETTGELEIKGFGTVKEGPVSLKLGILAGEGDKPISGDFLEIMDQKGNWTRLSHPNNTFDNFFNSSIYTPVKKADGSLQETPRKPLLKNNTGVDIVQWDIPNPGNSIIANNQTSARFRYGTNQDVYTLYAFAFSVLSYSPEIQAHNQIISIDGKTPTDSPTVKPGDEITYQLDIRNVGSETSEQTKIVIPIPYTAIFVDAKVIPEGNGTITFDPDLGISGSIIWNIGTIPLTENPQDIIASLEYTLKLTEDCFVLANDNCDAKVSVNGGISGVGGLSGQAYSDISFIREFMDGDCSEYGIYGPLEIPITGKAEFAATHCSGFELFTDLGPINLPDFCQGDTPADLSEYIHPSKEGYQIYFFSEEIGGTPLLDYYVNTSSAGKELVWVSEGPVGSCTGMRIPIELNVKPRSHEPFLEDKQFCMEDSLYQFTVDASPEFTILYYWDNNPLTSPMDTAPIVDLSIPKEFSIWVSQFKDGECESIRKEVNFFVEDCSLRPAIQLSISSDVEHYSEEGETINFTLTVRNTGGVRLEYIWLSEFLSYESWDIPFLEPSEEKTFTFSYNVTYNDILAETIYFNAGTGATSAKGEYVDDYEMLYVTSLNFPAGFIDYSIDTSPELCQNEGIPLGALVINWPQLQSGTYIFTNTESGMEYSGKFTNKNQIRHEVPAGSYTAEIFDAIGQKHSIAKTYIIEKREKVEFEIPENVQACGEYLLEPENPQGLSFKLIAPDGSIVKENSNGFFSIVQTGTYSITASDPEQVRCPLEKTFQADILLPYELELEVMPYCSEDTSTTLSLNTAAEGNTISWYKITLAGFEHLEEFENSTLIVVEGNGEYRATLTNEAGCTVGDSHIVIEQSFTEAPVLSNLYTICTEKNSLAIIEPGSRFKEFSWILDGVEVSNSSSFIPSLEGNYSLIAKDSQGCAFFADFEVEIKCKPEVTYPNAIYIGDSNRIFEIYPDNLSDEIELSIFNRWGQLIYYCEDKNLENEVKSSCVWNGTFNSAVVQNGSYLVLVRIKNFEQNMTVEQRSSILVFK